MTEPEELEKAMAAVEVALAGERRAVTVLLCEVKGSTATVEKLDSEEWASMMKRAYEDLIAPVSRPLPGRHRDQGGTADHQMFPIEG